MNEQDFRNIMYNSTTCGIKQHIFIQIAQNISTGIQSIDKVY